MIPAAIYKLSPPGYSLEVDGLPAGEAIRSRLISIGVNLYNGAQSDQLSLTFDDSPRTWADTLAVPKTGKKLKISLGYDLHKVLLGIFHVDQVTLNGSASGRTLSVTAVPKLLLDEHSRTLADTTIGDIVKDIASKNSLKAQVSSKLSSTKINIENQNRETDLSFLTKLATKYDAMFKPAGECLLFLEKGKAVTASGKTLSTISLGPSDIIQWNTQLSDRSAYEGVIATWMDTENALQVQVIAGKKTGKQDFYLKHLYSNAEEAQAAAKAKLKALQRDTTTLSLTVIGTPEIIANGKIKIKKLHSEIDGEWLVRSVTHTLDSSGYQCSLQCYREG
jgi:uncharacterized protein